MDDHLFPGGAPMAPPPTQSVIQPTQPNVVPAAPAAVTDPNNLPKMTYHAAGQGDDTAIVQWLDGGGHIDAREAETQGTLLMACSTSGDLRLVEALLQRGASIDLQGGAEHKGGTALMFAGYMGHYNVVASLLEHGANKELNTSQGSTALSMVEGEGHQDIALLLK
jgi:ankyrin repeat protein